MDKIMEDLFTLCSELYPFNYSVSGKDSEKAQQTYLKHLPFRVHYFSSGESPKRMDNSRRLGSQTCRIS